MELDINVAWVSYMWYSPGSSPTAPIPHKLVPFQRLVNRYLTPTSRDFFAVNAAGRPYATAVADRSVRVVAPSCRGSPV